MNKTKTENKDFAASPVDALVMWRKVEDELPKHNQQILMFGVYDTMTERDVYSGIYNKMMDEWLWAGKKIRCVSLWADLPKPPQAT